MADPITLFLNRERLVETLEQNLAKKREERESKLAKVKGDNEKVREQLVTLLNEHEDFFIAVVSLVRKHYGIDSKESLAGLTERFEKEKQEEVTHTPFDEERIEELIRTYKLSDAEQIELPAQSDVLNYV